MKIIIPCDWKPIDLLETENANDFGEALRNYCFIGNCLEIGCYSTFNVQKCFKKLTEGKIFEEAKKYLYEDIIPTVYYFKLEKKDCYIDLKCSECEGKFIDIKWAIQSRLLLVGRGMGMDAYISVLMIERLSITIASANIRGSG